MTPMLILRNHDLRGLTDRRRRQVHPVLCEKGGELCSSSLVVFRVATKALLYNFDLLILIIGPLFRRAKKKETK